ncbi:MAG: hypothetical protein KGI52_14495, partial [Burkholderiales bacterium]|nr:hypothetical protein [Burkholderiales bacterium]
KYFYSGLDDAMVLSPDTGSAVIWRDAMGNRYTTQTGSGTALASNTSLDALNRPKMVAHMSGVTLLGYDEASTTPGAENYGIGHLTMIQDKVYVTSVYGANTTASRIRLRYDRLGRVTARCQLWGANAASSTYTCMASDMLQYRWGPTSGANAGRLLGLTYPSGRLVDYTFDANGNISGITTTDPGSSTAKAVISSVSYVPMDMAGDDFAVSSFHFGDGSTAPVQSYSRSYDSQGRMTQFTLGAGAPGVSTEQATFKPQYDDASRLTSIDQTVSSVLTQAVYTYDDLGRLITASLPGGFTYSYSYDINGNRLTKVAGSTSTTYTYSAGNNKLTTVQVGAAAAQTQVTQGPGNVTTDVSSPVGSVNYSYVDNPVVLYGRPAQSQGPAGQYLYWYNYWGQRIRKTGSSYTPSGSSTPIAPVAYIGSTDTAYHYDLQGHLIAEVDATTQAVKREYIWLGDQPVAVIAGATPTAMIAAGNAPAVYYIHSDQLNTPRLVTDTAGVKRWSWDVYTAEPFGATAANEAPAGQASAQQFSLALRFAGQYQDKETGAYYNQWRTYSPALGRYLQSDPIGLNGGLNTYAYVRGNPLSMIDPYGRSA